MLESPSDGEVIDEGRQVHVINVSWSSGFRAQILGFRA